MSVLAMILAGGAAPGLSVLTGTRAESAVPFGGKYRVIDFALSNCVNSDIHNVVMLTQYMPRSLNDHIRAGKPWDLDRSEGGVRLLQPYQSSVDDMGAWQQGSADAVRFNMDVVRESLDDRVLLLSGNHIYKMNYGPMLEFHAKRQADVTVAVRAVNPHHTHRYGMITSDSDGRVTRFEEKPRRTRSTLASMGIYVVNHQVLCDRLEGPGRSDRNLGAQTIPALVRSHRVFAYPFEGYWANVDTVPAYYEANMALLTEIPALDLSDPRWVIHTRSEQRPPVFLGPEARVDGNLLCDGSRIKGHVRRSVIGPGVVVEEGAEVSDSIVMNDTVLGRGCRVERAILDKEIVVGEGAIVGFGEDNAPNGAMPHVLNTGVTVVGKRARVPAGAVLGRNVVVSAESGAIWPSTGEVISGTSVASLP